MNVTLLVVGKTDAGYWKDALEAYVGRLRHYLPFEIAVVRAPKKVKNGTEAQQKEQEGRLLLQSLAAEDCCILLDERGKELTSKEFASYIEKKMQLCQKRLVFVVGGPYGFSDAMYERASDQISISRMTFSHQMIRPIFVEQLYRAMTILRGEQYHHAEKYI